jgi:hypothetical protein
MVKQNLTETVKYFKLSANIRNTEEKNYYGKRFQKKFNKEISFHVIME